MAKIKVEVFMAEFFNDIVTFIATMDPLLKMSIVALLAILDIFIMRTYIRDVADKGNKPKIRLIIILLFILVSAILVLFARYSF